MQKKPNIVLITVDSLRADFCGFLNPKEKNTPFLDSIANKSYIFTNAISPASPTFFVFSSIMTGALPFTYGKYLGIPDNPKIKTLAEIMKTNGYGTYAFLADSPALYSIYGYQKGFDYYDDGYENTDKIYLSSLAFLWDLRGKIPEKLLRIIETVRTFTKIVFFSPKHSVPGSKLNGKVVEFFEQRKKKPFFLWLHYMDNHVPYFSGLDKYFFKNLNFAKRIYKKIVFYKDLATSLRQMKLKNHKTTEVFQEAYRSSVKYTDEYIGKMIGFIQHKYPNTVFIITSDHGESFMEHGLYGHEAYSLYNESIQIPLIIHIPSKKPQIITQTISLVSIAKTIAAIAGLNIPQFKGDNLLTGKVFSPINNISQILYKCRSPHVRLGILDNNTEIYGYKTLWSFTTPKEKYIVEADGEIEEYYNLSVDPNEKNNLVRNKTLEKNKIKRIKKIMKDTLSAE